MRPLPSPHPGYVLVIALVLVPVDVYVLRCPGAVGLLFVTGLLLDIAGAVLVAIPDIPALEPYTRVGHLRHVYREIGPGWGFKNRVNPDVDQSGVGTEAQRHGTSEFVRFLADVSEKRDFEEEVNWDAVHAIDISQTGGPGGPRLKTFSDADAELTLSRDHVRELLREEIDRLEGRFVRTGVALLVFGFGYQLIGYLIQL